MTNLMLRIVIPVPIIIAVAELSRRSPRLAGLLLTLPLVSILELLRRGRKITT